MLHATASSDRARRPLLVLAVAFATGAALFLLQHLKEELAAPAPARPFAARPAQAPPDRPAP